MPRRKEGREDGDHAISREEFDVAAKLERLRNMTIEQVEAELREEGIKVPTSEQIEEYRKRWKALFEINEATKKGPTGNA